MVRRMRRYACVALFRNIKLLKRVIRLDKKTLFWILPWFHDHSYHNGRVLINKGQRMAKGSIYLVMLT